MSDDPFLNELFEAMKEPVENPDRPTTYMGWSFTGTMILTDDGLALLFGRDVLAERLLWEICGNEFRGFDGDWVCCHTDEYEVLGDAYSIFAALVGHEPTCPWMRIHRFLNRSTDHGRYVHEWSE